VAHRITHAFASRLAKQLLRGFSNYARLLTLTGVPLLVVFDVKHFVVDKGDVSNL